MFSSCIVCDSFRKHPEFRMLLLNVYSTERTLYYPEECGSCSELINYHYEAQSQNTGSRFICHCLCSHFSKTVWTAFNSLLLYIYLPFLTYIAHILYIVWIVWLVLRVNTALQHSWWIFCTVSLPWHLIKTFLYFIILLYH